MTETYRIRSDETWARARDDYLAGMTAEQVCRRHDLGLRAFRDHARDGGWRRVDQPDPEPDDADADFAIFEDYDIEDLERMSRRRMIAATVRGDAMAANRWRRVYDLWAGEVAARRRRERDAAYDARIRAEREAREAAERAQDAPPPQPPSAPAEPPDRIENLHDLHSYLLASASSVALADVAAALTGPP